MDEVDLVVGSETMMSTSSKATRTHIGLVVGSDDEVDLVTGSVDEVDLVIGSDNEVDLASSVACPRRRILGKPRADQQFLL